MPSTVRTVLLDFYGTLGESDWSEDWLDALLAEHGHRVDRDAERRSRPEELDGQEHDEHSVDEQAYRAWQRTRWVELFAAGGVPEAAHESLLTAIDARRAAWKMEAYPEVHAVLAELRRRGATLVVCSNWDWDLDHQLDVCGIADLVDARVSSAWVGARKPHHRMFAAALDAVGAGGESAIHVGDSVLADVEGSIGAGLRAVHVWRRNDVEPPPLPDSVPRISDLRALLDLVP